MKKEEIAKLVNELWIVQQGATKFTDYYNDFCKEPRCKQGVREFIDTLKTDSNQTDNVLPWFDFTQMYLQLSSGKSANNSRLLRNAISDSQRVAQAAASLREQRKALLDAVCEYIRHIQCELDKSTLLDARERQLYLRRAVARLATLLNEQPQVVFTKEQWAEVEPCFWVNYLTTSMDEVLKQFSYGDGANNGGAPEWDWYGLTNKRTLDSILTYLDYLDSFLVY